MNNPRITPKDRNTIKGALRRAFSRSELHHKILWAATIPHSDPERPRVKTWCRCNVCKKPEAKSYCVVDHVSPLVPTDTAFEFMSFNVFLDRLWCPEENLQAICPTCHSRKSVLEMKERREHKRTKK